MKYETYGAIHRAAKKLLRRTPAPNYRLVSVDTDFISDGVMRVELSDSMQFFNDMNQMTSKIEQRDVFPVENVVCRSTFGRLPDSYIYSQKPLVVGTTIEETYQLWHEFVERSKIPAGYRNAGLSYAGYIHEANSWCLPSWIWTNAALVRMYCTTGETDKAETLARTLVDKQQPEGGWIVRFDYDDKGAIPIWAPNDSAYIANNACLEMFLATGKKIFLEAAQKCANWIMDTARPDGMVYVGYSMRERKWQIKHNIVDVGFTAGLFSRLYEITRNGKYKTFLDRFVQRYIELFYIEGKGFATSLDDKDQTFGGMFGRGQAWALEGLIPFYQITKDAQVKKVIETTITTLLDTQIKDGAWPYNLTRKMMGIDCKATPIIAMSLWNWYKEFPKKDELKKSALKALDWCVTHTATMGDEAGGIFSYCTEGAIVHSMYTNTAFVYSSAYAIELLYAVERERK